MEVVCALIVKNSRLLIVQKGPGSSHPYKWEFAGGKIKPGETDEDAIKREIAEELKIEIVIDRKLKSIDYDYGVKQITLIPFLCKINKGEIELTEHIACKWVTFEQLYNTDFSEADKQLIQHKKNIELLRT